ncbi:methyltransferase domain-containing protein [bacterium]|nr:methyltransferase domain-containing protein [bacterium]
MTVSFSCWIFLRGARILDIGAGTGNYFFALAEQGFTVVALEPSTVMSDQASDHSQVTWITGSAERLPIETSSFDAAILIQKTIYAMVYRDQKSGGDFHHFLRHPAKSYRNRSAGKEGRGRIKNQVMIDQRPPVVEERTRI